MRDVQVYFTNVATLESTVAALAPITENAQKPTPMTSYDATQFFPPTAASLTAFFPPTAASPAALGGQRVGGEDALSPLVFSPESRSPCPNVVRNVDHPRLAPVLRIVLTEKKLAKYNA